MSAEIGRDTCIFCRIADGHQEPFRGVHRDSIDEEEVIYRSENFILLPDIAPIRFGHLLILPVDHVRSAAELPTALRGELAQIREMAIRFLLGVSKRQVLEFEHGSVGLRNCGGCINHCHIHLLPIDWIEWHPILSIVKQKLGEPLESASISNSEYLSARLDGSSWCWSASNAQSQFFRRIIASELDEPSRANWLNSVDGTQRETACGEILALNRMWDAFLT